MNLAYTTKPFDGCQEGDIIEDMLNFLFKRPVFKYSLILIGILVIAQVLILTFGIKQREGQLFLHYTTYLGADFLGAWYLIYGIPFVSLVLALLNATLAHYLGKKEILLGYFFIIGSVIITLLLLIHALLIVLLNA